MTPEQWAALDARLARVELVLARFERLIQAAADAAPFWLRSKLKGAINDGNSEADRPAA